MDNYSWFSRRDSALFRPYFLISPENSISYYAALRDNNIPSSLHIWEDGGHGYGLAKNRGTIESWTKIVKNWLTLRGVIN